MLSHTSWRAIESSIEVKPRPLWSVMIPTYNRTAFLERALSSVLSQDPGEKEMQIEVVDNASTIDDPEPLVRRVGGNRVNIVRQPRNIGMCANFNSCIQRSRGEWVHILPSDDVVFPGFYARLKAATERRTDIGMAFCRHSWIDENDKQLMTSALERPTAGIVADFIDKIGVSSRTQCPAIVVKRSVYEAVGGFRTDILGADWEMWIRVAARYPVWFEPEILAAWRIHSQGATSDLMRSAKTLVDSRRCIEISHSALPPDRADAISKRARENLSVAALNGVILYLRAGEFTAAGNHFREGLKCGFSSALLKEILFLPFRIARGGVRRTFAKYKEPGV